MLNYGNQLAIIPVSFKNSFNSLQLRRLQSLVPFILTVNRIELSNLCYMTNNNKVQIIYATCNDVKTSNFAR